MNERKTFGNKELLEESFDDLRDDFEELEYLSESAVTQIDKFVLRLKKIRIYLRTESFGYILQKSLTFRDEIKQIINHMKDHKNNSFNYRTPESLDKLTWVKYAQFDLLRSIYGLIGPLVTSLDWQSPSYAQSLYSQAGTQMGRIIGTINDYKRDGHLDEEEYEKQFLKEYINAPLKFGIHTYMTSSGQAAFTTILNFLLMEGKIDGKVILGKSSYFQYKQLLLSLKFHVIEIDESNPKVFIQSIKNIKPSAIFLDSLCNAKDIPVPDFFQILDFLIKEYKKEIYLVIDNTCLSIAFQPFKSLIGKTRKVHLIEFESLMKYHHFGLDRATGGIIVAFGRDTQKLFEYRKHSGTNIPDASVYAFPTPSRLMLERRFRRFQRNVYILASSLQKHIANTKNSSIEKIVYPKLPHHVSYQWSKNLSFQGSFFNIEFRKKNTRIYKKFINLVINEAKKRKVQIVGGTSFGMNNTRIYLTSLWTKFGEPFVRVSVGTENRYQIEILKEVLKSAMDKIDKSFF